MEMMNSIIDAIPNISVISQIEVLRFNATPEVYKILEDFINESTIFDLNGLVIASTIAICKSHKIKLPDAIIAATAIVYNFTLITRNTSDFKNIQNLKFLNPWDAMENQSL